MNYYERHLGDYARDTAHLSMLEHGAYTLLMDRYYATEQGIPADQAHRVARARSKEERQAVDVVLEEFFYLEDGVWKKGRVEEEITKAQTKIKAAQENGKRGGRPKRNQTQTEEKPSGLSVGSETETQQKAHQTPDTSNANKQSEQDSSSMGTPAGRVCARLVKIGFSQINPADPRLIALLKAGATEDEIAGVGEEAKAKGKGFAWVLVTAENRRREAGEITKLPDRKTPEVAWWTSEAATLAKGESMNPKLLPRPGEGMAEFRGRITAAIEAQKQAGAA